MEAGFPGLRHRKFARRSDYMPLDNDSDADSCRRPIPSRPPPRPRGYHAVLCDKCWVRQERSKATKRCLDCKQNLCKGCAKCEEVARPWWLPQWVLQCWRFLFADVYTPHSVVDLNSYGSAEGPHWAHTHEASQIRTIPRVPRSNRSNRSNESSDRRQPGRPSSVCSDKGRQRRSSGGKSPRNDTKQLRRLKHSQSFDGRPRRSLERGTNRPWGSGPLVCNYKHDDIERLRRYKENWERAFDEHSHEYFGTNLQASFNNKFIGTDVMIELTDKDAKVIVNEESDSSKRKKKGSAIMRRKLKGKSKSDSPGKFTEEIFQEVPIWFKKSSKDDMPNTDNYPRGNRKEFSEFCKADVKQDVPYRSNETRKRMNGRGHTSEYERIFNSFTNRDQGTQRSNFNPEGRTDYIVEEPADTCPICLEDLPGSEARLLTCSHVFHTNCLRHLLTSSDMDFGINCPSCSQTTYIQNYYTSKENWLQELPVWTTV